MSTQTYTRPSSFTRPIVGARAHRVALVAVVAAMLAGALVWQALDTVDVAVGEYTRGELAQIERLEGQAAAYEQFLLQRAYQADAARWTAQAEFYEQVRQARAEVAATARLQGQAREHLLSQMTPADRAWARRLQGQAELLLEP